VEGVRITNGCAHIFRAESNTLPCGVHSVCNFVRICACLCSSMCV
jgi:hypothetical protein